jgi:hypothetical protein
MKYFNENKDKLKEKWMKYYNQNKDIILEK